MWYIDKRCPLCNWRLQTDGETAWCSNVRNSWSAEYTAEYQGACGYGMRKDVMLSETEMLESIEGVETSQSVK